MLSCRESSELVSRGLDARLSVPERLGLALHLRMCAGCAAYRRQLTQLREVLQRGARELPELAALHSFRLSDADRDRLTRALAGDQAV